MIFLSTVFIPLMVSFIWTSISDAASVATAGNLSSIINKTVMPHDKDAKMKKVVYMEVSKDNCKGQYHYFEAAQDIEAKNVTCIELLEDTCKDGKPNYYFKVTPGAKMKVNYLNISVKYPSGYHSVYLIEDGIQYSYGPSDQKSFRVKLHNEIIDRGLEIVDVKFVLENNKWVIFMWPWIYDPKIGSFIDKVEDVFEITFTDPSLQDMSRYSVGDAEMKLFSHAKILLNEIKDSRLTAANELVNTRMDISLDKEMISNDEFIASLPLKIDACDSFIEILKNVMNECDLLVADPITNETFLIESLTNAKDKVKVKKKKYQKFIERCRHAEEVCEVLIADSAGKDAFIESLADPRIGRTKQQGHRAFIGNWTGEQLRNWTLLLEYQELLRDLVNVKEACKILILNSTRKDASTNLFTSGIKGIESYAFMIYRDKFRRNLYYAKGTSDVLIKNLIYLKGKLHARMKSIICVELLNSRDNKYSEEGYQSLGIMLGSATKISEIVISTIKNAGSIAIKKHVVAPDYCYGYDGYTRFKMEFYDNDITDDYCISFKLYMEDGTVSTSLWIYNSITGSFTEADGCSQVTCVNPDQSIGSVKRNASKYNLRAIKVKKVAHTKLSAKRYKPKHSVKDTKVKKVVHAKLLSNEAKEDRPIHYYKAMLKDGMKMLKKLFGSLLISCCNKNTSEDDVETGDITHVQLLPSEIRNGRLVHYCKVTPEEWVGRVKAALAFIAVTDNEYGYYYPQAEHVFDPYYYDDGKSFKMELTETFGSSRSGMYVLIFRLHIENGDTIFSGPWIYNSKTELFTKKEGDLSFQNH